MPISRSARHQVRQHAEDPHRGQAHRRERERGQQEGPEARLGHRCSTSAETGCSSMTGVFASTSRTCDADEGAAAASSMSLRTTKLMPRAHAVRKAASSCSHGSRTSGRALRGERAMSDVGDDADNGSPPSLGPPSEIRPPIGLRPSKYRRTNDSLTSATGAPRSIVRRRQTRARHGSGSPSRRVARAHAAHRRDGLLVGRRRHIAVDGEAVLEVLPAQRKCCRRTDAASNSGRAAIASQPRGRTRAWRARRGSASAGMTTLKVRRPWDRSPCRPLRGSSGCVRRGWPRRAGTAPRRSAR